METLSTVLTHLMTQNRINSAQLARKTGIGQPVIYRIMTGATDNPQTLTLKPIADYFKISLDQLLGFKSLDEKKALDHTTMHLFNNKITSIKTIAGVLVDILPCLIDGYSKAVTANLLDEEISKDILPLLTLNSSNLLKAITHLQEIINDKKND